MQAKFPNGFVLTHLIGTSPARFDGKTQDGYDFGLEFYKDGGADDTSPLHWRIAYTKDGSRIKFWSNQEKMKEGYEYGYVETNISTGEVRFERTCVPNDGKNQETIKMQLVGTLPVNKGAFSGGLPTALQFAMVRNKENLTVAKMISGGKMLVRSFAVNNNTIGNDAESEKCLSAAGKKPTVLGDLNACNGAKSTDLAVNPDKVSAFTQTADTDAKKLTAMTDWFNATASLTWKKPEVFQ